MRVFYLWRRGELKIKSDKMDFNLLVEKIESLPSLPQAYHKCCFLLEREVTDSKDLAQVVATDPGMTMAVLRLVNSAFYNIPRKIERLDHAISIIGHTKFSDLILMAAVVKAMSSLASGAVDMEVFWRHSIYTGLIAKRLALQAYLVNSERLFLGGLLHDVGQLVYFDMQETQALKVVELVKKFNVGVDVAEKKVLGYTHHDIASSICQRWQLPEWLEQPIANYNSPSKSQYFKQEAAILSLANTIASQYYPGLTSLGEKAKNAEIKVQASAIWANLNIDIEMLPEIISDADEQLASVIQSLVPDLSCVG